MEELAKERDPSRFEGTCCQVRFLPEGARVEVPAGTTLLDALRTAGLKMQGSCGGKGTCGKCKVRILAGEFRSNAGVRPHRDKQGYVNSCQVIVTGDVTVEVPPESRIEEPQVDLGETGLAVRDRYELDPAVRRIDLEMTEPSLLENLPDLARLVAAARKALRAGGHEPGELTAGLGILKAAPSFLRSSGWKARADVSLLDPGRAEIVALRPARPATKPFGLAIDVGTTTVALYLVDLESGAAEVKLASYNEQFLYGDDVITRIVHATSSKRGLEDLRKAVLRTVNGLVGQAVAKAGITAKDLSCAVVAGNTTMIHLFLGIDPKHLRLEPYIPAATEFPAVKGKEAGLHMNEEGPVLFMPAVASYVGGDVVSGMLATGAGGSEDVNLFVDVGTNGEMVLGNRDWLVSCACSAGPCFEGGGVTSGMRAMRGAIHRISINPGNCSVRYSTFGRTRPLGICGSGLVELLAEMRMASIIDSSGAFQEDRPCPRLREGPEGLEFVVARGRESGASRDLTITTADVENLMRAKAAVFAGIRCLLKSVGMEASQIHRVYIAGGFGASLDMRRAVEIGLLPDLPQDRYVFAGNASVKGARAALLSRKAFEEARNLARRMTYLELSVGSDFMDEFVSAMFLPHTDAGMFPSVKWES